MFQVNPAYLSFSQWWHLGGFWGLLLQSVLLLTLCMTPGAHLHKFLWGGCLTVELISHRLHTSSLFLGSTKLFCKVLVLINTPFCGMEVFLVLYVFTSSWFFRIFKFLLNWWVKMLFHCGLRLNISIYLSAIWVSPSMRCLFIILSIFLTFF